MAAPPFGVANDELDNIFRRFDHEFSGHPEIRLLSHFGAGSVRPRVGRRQDKEHLGRQGL